MMYGCWACHESMNGVIRQTNSDACASCHDDEYEEILTEWVSETQESLDGITDRLLSINYIELKEDEQLKIDQIRDGVKLIQEDGSNGAHNIEMVTEWLHDFNEILGELSK